MKVSQLKRQFIVAFAASIGAVSVALGAAELKSYVMPGYVFGDADNNVDRSSRPEVTTTNQLAFPGATLAEIRNLTFCGYMWSMNQPGLAQSYFTHDYTVNGELKALAVTVQKLDFKNNSDSYIKSAAIKLTQVADGVWAQRVDNSPYFSTTDAALVATKDFSYFDANGNINFHDHSGVGPYLVRAFCALAPVPANAPALAFANPAGGTILTVNDIRDYAFTGIITGGAVNPVFTRHPMQNKHVECGEDGVATSIRLELQVQDGDYLKCAVVQLTNGADGVYAQTTDALLWLIKEGVRLGDPFLKPDGTLASTDIIKNTSAPTAIADYYGAASLTATYMAARTYELDESKTWSELTGSSQAVDDPELSITVNVTAPDATLTFDVPVAVHDFAFASSDGHGVTFAAANGVAAPSAAVWDLRGTTGSVTFANFSPVTDAVTANILPNAVQTLVFAGDLGGILPFNAASASLPCGKLVLGGVQVFPSGLAFNKVKAMDAAGSVVFGGNVTGTATLNFAEGGTLGVSNDVTIANTVTFADGAAVPVVAYGDAARLTVGGTKPVNGFVLTGGTLHAAVVSQQETNVVIGAGGTLAVTVTPVQKHTGYTTPATVLEGGVVRFFDERGEELGVGRPDMLTLPGTDVAWSPSNGEGGSLADPTCWSSSGVPSAGSDVTLSSGSHPGATARFSTSLSYGQVSIGSGSDLVLAPEEGGSGTLSVGTLVVAPNAKVTITLPNVVCTAVSLGDGSELRVRGAGVDAQTFNAAVSGTGKVVYLGGDVTPTVNSSYSGGTVVKPGAYVRMGHDNALGAEKTTVKVEKGGTLDTNDHYGHKLKLDLCGDGVMLADGTPAGALRSTGAVANYGKVQFVELTLSGPASICVDGEDAAVGLVAPDRVGDIPITLGTNTLTKTGSGTLYLTTEGSVATSGSGKVLVVEGRVYTGFYLSDDACVEGSFGSSGATLEIATNGTVVTHGNLSFGKIVNNGRLELRTFVHDLTVAGSYEGDGEVHKYGDALSAGMPFHNGCHTTWYVHGGRLYPTSFTNTAGDYQFNTAENPNANPKVVVEALPNKRAKFDLAGIADLTLAFVLSGYFEVGGSNGKRDSNALCNNGSDVDSGTKQTIQITLADDTRVGGPHSFGLVAPGHKESLLELGDKTMILCLASGKSFWMMNTTVTGTGRVQIESGNLYFNKGGKQGRDWTLDVGANGSAEFVTPVTVSNLVFSGTAKGSALVTAYGTYAPHGSSLPKVTLTGAGAGLDLSTKTEPWAIPSNLSFAADTTVTVKVGGRELAECEKLLSWSSRPSNTTWRLEPTERMKKFHLRITDGGLYVCRTRGTVIVVQ